jgi:rhamnose transport system permease protein
VSAFKIGSIDFRLMVVISLAVVFVFHLIVTYLPVGRRLYAIGSNPDAARIAGFPAKRISFLAFVLCGALAGIAGFAFLARFGNITVVAGQGMELQSVAAAVVGGASTSGGIGTMFGALLGSILIDLLDQSLIRWLAISEFWRDALLGALILAFVAIDTVVIARLRKMWARNDLQLTRTDDIKVGEAEGVSHAR